MKDEETEEEWMLGLGKDGLISPKQSMFHVIELDKNAIKAHELIKTAHLIDRVGIMEKELLELKDRIRKLEKVEK